MRAEWKKRWNTETDRKRRDGAKGFGARHQLYVARTDPSVMRLRRPLQSRGGGPLSGQGDQFEPTVDPRPASRHTRGTPKTGPGRLPFWITLFPLVPRRIAVYTTKLRVWVNVFQVFIKSELKVGVIYVKEGQYSEEEILDNNEHSPLFDEFLQIIGDKVKSEILYKPFLCKPMYEVKFYISR